MFVEIDDISVQNEQIVDGDNKDVKEIAPEEIGDGHIKRPKAQRGEGHGHLWQRSDEGDEQGAFNKEALKTTHRALAGARQRCVRDHTGSAR